MGKSINDIRNEVLEIIQGMDKIKRITHKLIITIALKKYWLSNYMIQRLVKSSSGDRTARTIRENPPINYVLITRQKKMPKNYNDCQEYRLVRADDV